MEEPAHGVQVAAGTSTSTVSPAAALHAEAAALLAGASDGDRRVALRFLLGNQEAGVVIGRRGSNRNEIQLLSQAKLRLSEPNQFWPGSSDRVLLIAGPLLNVVSALLLVFRKIQESSTHVSQSQPLSGEGSGSSGSSSGDQHSGGGASAGGASGSRPARTAGRSSSGGGSGSQQYQPRGQTSGQGQDLGGPSGADDSAAGDRGSLPMGPQGPESYTQVKLLLPAVLCGTVIGPGGRTIQQISSECGVSISLSPQDYSRTVDYERVATVTGARDSVLKAIVRITNRLLASTHSANYFRRNLAISSHAYPARVLPDPGRGEMDVPGTHPASAGYAMQALQQPGGATLDVADLSGALAGLTLGADALSGGGTELHAAGMAPVTAASLAAAVLSSMPAGSTSAVMSQAAAQPLQVATTLYAPNPSMQQSPSPHMYSMVGPSSMPVLEYAFLPQPQQQPHQQQLQQQVLVGGMALPVAQYPGPQGGMYLTTQYAQGSGGGPLPPTSLGGMQTLGNMGLSQGTLPSGAVLSMAMPGTPGSGAQQPGLSLMQQAAMSLGAATSSVSGSGVNMGSGADVVGYGGGAVMAAMHPMQVAYALPVPEASVGALIGRAGFKLKQFKDMFGVKVVVADRSQADPATRTRNVYVSGGIDAVRQCCARMSQLVQEFMAKQGVLWVPPAPTPLQGTAAPGW